MAATSSSSAKKRKLSDADSPRDDDKPKKQKKGGWTWEKGTVASNVKTGGDNDQALIAELHHERSLITHLRCEQRILLLGEGDFSFAASLCRLGFLNIVATSAEDYRTVVSKYYNSLFNLEILERMKCAVHHNVDVAELHKHVPLSLERFDVIIFNYPHSGVANFEYKKSIPSNQALLRSIFTSSANLLILGGELHITIKSDPIYNSWDIQKQCKDVGNALALKARIGFQPQLFFGYQHKTTTASVQKTTVASDNSFVWIFAEHEAGKSDWKPIVLPVGQTFHVGMFVCKTCHCTHNTQKRFEMHMNSKAHKETVLKRNKGEKIVAKPHKKKGKHSSKIKKKPVDIEKMKKDFMESLK